MEFLQFLKSLVGVLPFIGLCLAGFKINLNKADRSRQFLMPIIALAYCILGVVLLDFIEDILRTIFGLLANILTFFVDVSWQTISSYVLNSAMIAGFFVIKGILLPVINGIWKSSNSLSEATSGLFYDREEDVDKWLLKPQFANFRGFVKGFYYASLIVSVAVFALSQNFPESIFFKATFYPVFGLIVLGEVVHFLSGMTKTEFVEDVLGEDEESYKVANYGILREILRNLFKDRVLYESTGDASDGISETFDELDEMVRSEDPTLKMIGSYYSNLKKSGADIDINYVRSTVNLLNGKSTLFCNPFYRDLSHYITLPMVRQLIRYKKCLVVLGRDSALEDVKKWIDSGLESFSSTDSLWQSQVLDEHGNVSDVGIIKFCDIHNLKIHRANKEFLQKVGFVLIIEPSRILASGQIGLSLLVNNCEEAGKDIVYCACDRNCDGLVDALSHTLKTSITEVTATVNGGGNNSNMYWDADGSYMHHKIFPNISRYLGMGTEINAVAMKFKLENTGWVGSEKFPVLDMKWIAGQYHKTICHYADLPESQASFERTFNVYSNLWSTERKDNSFLVVEDEFQNLFEITRVFASRARSQGFVNVISENYFLRDYMIDNVDIFTADPKAIPTIVPDFARTERNMVLKLIMMMAYEPVSEERIAKELMLCGIPFEDPYTTLKALISKHCNVDDASLSVKFNEELQNDSLNSVIVKYYEIDETNELFEYARFFRNAYYIAEDEEGESHFIGAKLYTHVFQAMLPGQFMTFDGKYYEVQTVTPLNGVVVRRAADHITDRRYYKQIRRVSIGNWADGTEMGSKRTSSDIEITRGFADISVETDGYLDMSSYGNLKKAKKIELNGIPTRKYRNKSVLKIKLPDSTTNRIRFTICLLLNEIFRTTYPETYHYISALTPYSDDIKSEKLAFATYRLDCEDEEENCIYIVEDSDIDLGLIVSVERNLKRYFEIITDVLEWHNKKMGEKYVAPEEESDEEFVPDFGEKPEPEKKGIPGLIEKTKEAWEKWRKRKKKDSAEPEKEETVSEPAPEPAPESESVSEPESEPAPESVPETVAEVEETEETSPETVEEEPVETSGEVPETEPTPEQAPEAEETVETPDEESAEETAEDGYGENAHNPADEEVSEESSGSDEELSETEENGDGTDSDDSSDEASDKNEDSFSLFSVMRNAEPYREESEATSDIGGEDEELAEGGDVFGEATTYQNSCFLKFGFDDFDEVLDINGTLELLGKLGFDKNPLKQTREQSYGGTEESGEYDPKKYGVHMCDFCGVELVGGDFEVLKDGRERCNRCSMTAIKKVEDFKTLYKAVLRNMEAFYGIKLNVAVKVRTTNAKQIAKFVGTEFTPSPGFDGRVLGFARKDKTGYSLYIENGSPKLAATATIAHELTHIWQYLNWNEADIIKKYGQQNMLEVYEGMAKWAEIQYLMLMNEKTYAKRQEIITMMRNDEYGRGFIIYTKKYPLSNESSVKKTPFKENPPL